MKNLKRTLKTNTVHLFQYELLTILLRQLVKKMDSYTKANAKRNVLVFKVLQDAMLLLQEQINMADPLEKG